jgi:hypothetical protein
VHFRASGCLLLAWGLTACSTIEESGSERVTGRRKLASILDVRWGNCAPGRVCLAFSRQDECPNWDAALALAKERSGCVPVEGGEAQTASCRKRLACDICRFLDDAEWPPAYVRDFPGGKVPLLGHVEGATEIRERYSPGSINAAWVEFRKARCYGTGVGVWPFWEDNVEYLAKAMMHESLHLCKIIGGYGPSTVDPTTEDIVEDCFR